MGGRAGRTRRLRRTIRKAASRLRKRLTLALTDGGHRTAITVRRLWRHCGTLAQARVDDAWCWFRGFGLLWNGRVVADGEEVPVAWHAFERVSAAFGELEARAGYEVADGAGNEHFAWVGEGGD